MSVKSATEFKPTATTAEPPKKSTPSQPWQATGLTYYHNEYVNRAADLGCCGVTQLLIFADSSLFAKVGKIALFAIVSLGFAMIDVIRAAWTKISGSRTVAPVTPVAPAKPTTITPAAPASTSTTEASSKPADAAKPKPTADESNAEETQKEETEADPLSSAPSYDPKAIEGLTKQEQHGTNMLARAIGSLQDAVSQRLSTDALKEAILEVRNKANTFAKNFTKASSTHQAALKDASKELEALKKSLLKLNTDKTAFVKAAHSLYPEEVFAAAPEFFKDVPLPSGYKSAPPMPPTSLSHLALGAPSSSSTSSLSAPPGPPSGYAPIMPPQTLAAPLQSSPSLAPTAAPSSSSTSSLSAPPGPPSGYAPIMPPQTLAAPPQSSPSLAPTTAPSSLLETPPSKQKKPSQLSVQETPSTESLVNFFASLSDSSNVPVANAQTPQDLDNTPFSLQPSLLDSSKHSNLLFTPLSSGTPEGAQTESMIKQLKKMRDKMESLGRKIGVSEDELSAYLKRRDTETNLNFLQRLQKQKPLWEEYATLQTQITKLSSSLKRNPSPIWKAADEANDFPGRLNCLKQKKLELEQEVAAKKDGSA
jgi:hypothetical protein